MGYVKCWIDASNGIVCLDCEKHPYCIECHRPISIGSAYCNQRKHVCNNCWEKRKKE